MNSGPLNLVTQQKLVQANGSSDFASCSPMDYGQTSMWYFAKFSSTTAANKKQDPSHSQAPVTLFW